MEYYEDPELTDIAEIIGDKKKKKDVQQSEQVGS